MRPRGSHGRPRLVHVTTSDMSLALLLGPQLAAYRRAGYDVIGVSAPGPEVPTIAALGVEHVPLANATRAPSLRHDLRALVELRSLFRRLRPAIVHTHNPKPGVYGRLAARMAGVPVVVNTVHGLYALPDDPLAKRGLVYSLERVAAACSDAEFFQNAEDLEVMNRLRVPTAKLHLAGNGIDLERFDRSLADPARVASVRAEMRAGPDDIVCGVVGRLVWEKGCREIFAAARELRARRPSVRFALVGPDDPAKPDRIPPADLDRARNEGGVCFLGRRDDMVDVYAAMDIFVIASYREGFSRSGMEAAAMGLPIVATGIRGCREVVDAGVSGILVPVRDAPALVDAVVGLADDPAARAAMGAAGTVKARREFDQQRVIELTLDVYSRLLERNGVRTGAA